MAKHEEEVPWTVLEHGYDESCKQFNLKRETWAATTAAVERCREVCGPKYAHIPLDWYRHAAVTCSKNPDLYGWKRRSGNGKHGPAKGHKLLSSANGSKALAEDLASRKDWSDLSQACKDRDGNRCRTCNVARGIQAHHRTYQNYGRGGLEELQDLTTLCSNCHNRLHGSKAFQRRVDWSGVHGIIRAYHEKNGGKLFAD